MNKKLIIVLIGILVILSLSIGAYYTISLDESPIENITSDNVSENNSNDNNNIVEKSASGNSKNGKSDNTSSKPNNSNSNLISQIVDTPNDNKEPGCK